MKKLRSRRLSASIARRMTVICAAVFVSSPHAAHAGINVWTSHGPAAVPVTALAVDPTTRGTLYAVTDGGAVFKSTDGATNWQAANFAARALVFDPGTPGTLYAGAAGSCSYDVGSCSVGFVLKSTDGGETWQALSTGLSGEGAVIALAVDPTTPRTIYAGTSPLCPLGDVGCTGAGGVFTSTDGGESWRAVNAGLSDLPVILLTYVLAIDPTTPGTLYAVVADWGVFKSTDAAISWQAVNSGLPDSAPVNALAIDPFTPSTLYVGAYGGGVFKSTDAGATWLAANAGLTTTGVFALAIDPRMPNTLYVGTTGGVFKSRDGATTWQPLNTGLPNISVLALAIDPITPGKVYAGTEDGVFSIQQVPAAKLVGTGTTASCTDAALNAALVGGGLVTFNCGPAPVTIDIGYSTAGTGTKTIATDTTIDGGGLITISGGNTVDVFSVDTGATFTVRNLTIAGGGSGIHNDGTLTVTNSTFSGNGAGYGGGIFNGGTLTVTSSTFSGNSALYGGGIFNGGTLTVTNSTFFGNSASFANHTIGGGSGGGIDNNGTLTVANSTFSGNNAVGPDGIASNGGSINNDGGAVTATNTIVANSGPGGNCSGAIADGGHNLDDGTSCGFSTANGSLNNTNPQLDPAGLQDNGGPTQTVALCTAVGVPAGCTAASPVIDAGDQAVCALAPVSDRDQRGFVRPGTTHTHCSIGAYEADATAAEPCVGDCGGMGTVVINDLVTLVNIALGNAEPSACPYGIRSGTDVDVTLIIQAVNNALKGCG